MSKLPRRGVVSLVVVGLVASLSAAAGVAWSKLYRRERPTFRDAEEAFKYRSIGNIETQGLPYYVWLVLPRVFGAYLPGNGGYASLGLAWEPGRETPVGFAKETVGFPRIAFNCALCHAGSYRTEPGGAATVVAAGPAHQADPQAYLEFLFRCANDPRFTADVLLPVIAQNVQLSFLDALLYRHVLIPRTRDALRAQSVAARWMHDKPRWGPGRIDPFNPVKLGFLGMHPDATVGNADNVPIWSMATRTGQKLHWDGMNDSLREVVLSSALGDGATPDSLNVGELVELETWLLGLPPPRFPGAVDAALAARGENVFHSLCADCHGQGGARTGTVVPVAEVGTDAARHALWTGEAARRYNRYTEGHDFAFTRFVGTDGPRDGYVATPLMGLWLRGPYFHNGSVPTLEDVLAEPYDDASAALRTLPSGLAALPRLALRRETEALAEVQRLVAQARIDGRRPPVFFRGLDVLDRVRVGFVSDAPAPPEEPQLFVYDTRLRGNGNRGHAGPAYGTTLPRDDKRALVEYLKTL